MQAGLPFLTYNTGDVANNISKLLPELVMHSFEQQTWLTSITTILKNEPTRNAIKIKMKQVVEEIYTEEKYWQRLSNVYKTVLQ